MRRIVRQAERAAGVTGGVEVHQAAVGDQGRAGREGQQPKGLEEAGRAHTLFNAWSRQKICGGFRQVGSTPDLVGLRCQKGGLDTTRWNRHGCIGGPNGGPRCTQVRAHREPLPWQGVTSHETRRIEGAFWRRQRQK